MKKKTMITAAVAVIAIVAVAGIVMGIYRNSVAGVYHAESWHGKTGTLVLFEDGTCQYPSGGTAEWVLIGDTVRITVERRWTLADESLGENVEITEYEAKVVENGLLLEGTLFMRAGN